MTHDKQLDMDFARDDPDFFDRHVKSHVKAMQIFFDHMFKLINDNNVPMIFLKFEQLIEQPKESLASVFKFLLNTNDLTGTVAEKKIDEVL